MSNQQIRAAIENGNTVLGIELGSTRIKAVLLDAQHAPIASGGHNWENHLTDGVWTYPLAEVWSGLAACYADLKRDVRETYGVTLRRVGALGVSAMMHGYLAFDKNGALLAPFRTWRNTITGEAAAALTALFNFNIPQRWSVAHLYQAMLNKEPHVRDIARLNTLAGYVHQRLTGQFVLGVGDASGMFPIDSQRMTYDADMLSRFDALPLAQAAPWKLADILPRVLAAGQDAGALTPDGALLLDAEGDLQSGVPLCPPEGDAGTGMTATNSVGVRTGNVSAGTSIFAMIVLEKPLSALHTQIDMVATPDGMPVAMAHCNNCTSDLNAWAGLFAQVLQACGHAPDIDALFTALFEQSLAGEADCGGLVNFNYLSGEHVTGMEEGRPLLTRLPDARLSLPNFMRAQIFSALATLKVGMDILLKDEKVRLDRVFGHGGFFKTRGVGQRFLAAAIDAPVSVMETAGEGGAWGVALLAAYALRRAPGETLPDYLSNRVFTRMRSETLAPDPADRAGFEAFIARYTACLPIERIAVDTLR